MPTTDFSRVPDDQMDHIMGLLESNPDFIPNVEERRAFTAEYFRRRKPAAASPAPNVEQNLDAAATPIPVEPMAGPSRRDAYAARMEAAGYTPQEAGMAADYEGTMEGAYELPESDETLRRGAAYQRDQDRRMGQFDASLADAMGHNVGPGMSTEIMPNAGSRPAWAENAFGGEMINVDGVMVQAYDLGDGKLRYSLGDVKRAQEAQMAAQRDASWRAMIDDDKAKYGDTLPKAQLTLDQLRNRDARSRAEANQRAQYEARRQFQIANKDRPLTPSEQSRKERRETRAYMAGLAGGSSGLRGGPGGNMAGLRALAMLRGVDRKDMTPEQRNLLYAAPGGRAAAEVDAKNNEQLTALGLRVAQGQGFQQMDPVQREALEQRVDQGKPVQVRAQERVAAGNLNHPDVQAHAENIVATTYSSAPGALGISSDFTDNEVALAAQRLADDTGMDIENAQAMMRRLQAERRRNSLASSVVAWFYDQ